MYRIFTAITHKNFIQRTGIDNEIQRFKKKMKKKKIIGIP
jgi:hypothetical protein